MLKQAMNDRNTQQLADAAMMASRQVWLAGLGAATIARRWASRDAVPFFHSLVKQGEIAESTVLHALNAEIGTSAVRAARMWNSTREAVSATVNTLAATAATVLPQANRAAKSRAPNGGRKAPGVKSTRAVKTSAKRPAKAQKRIVRKG